MKILMNATPLVLVARWAEKSQQHARRNAMTATTVLTARRLERLDVEHFVAETLARRRLAAPAPLAHVRAV